MPKNEKSQKDSSNKRKPPETSTRVETSEQPEAKSSEKTGIWIHNLKGEILEVNDAYCRMSGYTREELIGMQVSKVEAVAKPAQIAEHIKKLLEQDGHDRLESKHRRKDGSVYDVDITALYVEKEGKIAIFVRDISERKKTEEQLLETRNYLENLLDYANTPIIVWNPERQITRFNHAFERLTGQKAEDVIGKPLDILFPEKSREESLQHIERASSGEYWQTVEVPVMRVDGEVRTVLWNSANTYGKDGTTVEATIAQGVDITERNRFEKKLRLYSEHLEKLV